MNIIRSFLLLHFIVVSLCLQAQETSVASDAVSYFQERLSAYQATHPSNNLFLHLDKTVYAPEETIWFKAYLLADTSLEAKVLYVRIIDQEHTVMADVQFPVYDIRSHGSIQLSKPGNTRQVGYRHILDPPRILLDGNYTLYAYTDRMVSLNDTNVFVQPFRVRRVTGSMLQAEATVMDTAQLEKGGSVQVKTTIRSGGSLLENARGEYQLLSAGKEIKYGRLSTNAFGEAFVNFIYPDLPDEQSLQLKMLFTRDHNQAELSLNLPHRGNPLTINCYPEGGTLTAGGRVSVEVLDIHGHPVSTGLLVKRGGETMDSLHTDEQGTAVWEVPAVAGISYMLLPVNGRGKQELTIPLLSNRQAGYHLRLYNDTTGCRAVIRNDGAEGEALLVLRSLNEVIWSHPVQVMPGDSVMMELPVRDLPKGIWNLALFDGNNRLRAERLFMNKQTDDYQVTITTEQQEYGPRKRVKVRMQVTDAAGNPVIANLSVSATEKRRLDSTLFRDIRHSRYSRAFAPGFHRRLLTAHADGPDGLLLGRYWPNHRWNDILSDTDTGIRARIPNTNGTTGRMVGTKYVTKRSQLDYRYLPTKEKFRTVYLRGVKEMTFTNSQFESAMERKTIEVKNNMFFIPDTLLFSRKGREWQLEIPRGGSAWAHRCLVEWQDPDIGFDSTIVRGSQLRVSETLSSYATTKAPGITAFDFQGINALQEVVIGKKEKPVQRRLRISCCEQYEDMLFSHLPGMKLRKGQTHPFSWYYAGGGKIIMYLGCGRYRDINYIRNITIPEEFPLPDYELYPSTVEDIRSTIYWSPNVMTDADGMATFSFFTSETTGEFTIMAQGLALDTLIPMMGKGEFKVNRQ